MTVKISNLPAATSVGSGDVLPVVQSGTTKKIDLNSPWSINIDGGNIDGTPIGVSSASSGAFTTLTASDDVNFDSGTLFVDASANTVGIGKTAASFLKLDVNGLLGVSSSSTPILQIGDIGGTLRFQGITSLDQTFWTNNQERMRIDSSGQVGIGTTSPSAKLEVKGSTSTYAYITCGDTTGVSGLWFGDSDADSRGRVEYLHTNDNMRFFTSASERMRIDSSGHAIIPAGVTLGTAAGVYNAANTLDDYEEGTWTPRLSGTTGGDYTPGSLNKGRYTKIGDTVTVYGTLSWSAQVTPYSGLLIIDNLPFTSRNETNCRHSGAIGVQAVGVYCNSGYTRLGISIDPNNDYIYIVQADETITSGSNFNHTPTALTSGNIFGFTITYTV